MNFYLNLPDDAISRKAYAKAAASILVFPEAYHISTEALYQGYEEFAASLCQGEWPAHIDLREDVGMSWGEILDAIHYETLEVYIAMTATPAENQASPSGESLADLVSDQDDVALIW